MGNYATNADVIRRLPGRNIGATAGNQPTTADIDAWITEIEAVNDAELKAQALTVPVTDTTGKNYLKGLVTSMATARFLDAVTELADTEGKAKIAQLKDEFGAWIELIRREPSRAASIVGQGFGTSPGKADLRSYVTDNADGLTVDAPDPSTTSLDPVFTKAIPW